MRFFSLRQTSHAVLFAMSAVMMLSVSAQAATVKAAKVATNATNKADNVATQATPRLTPANSTNGILALVNDNAILKSDLMDAVAQTQARAQAAGDRRPEHHHGGQRTEHGRATRSSGHSVCRCASGAHP